MQARCCPCRAVHAMPSAALLRHCEAWDRVPTVLTQAHSCRRKELGLQKVITPEPLQCLYRGGMQRRAAVEAGEIETGRCTQPNPHSGRMQAALRSARGEEATAFERMEDGGRSISKGDVVRLSVKPAVVGAVLHFSVPQVILFTLLMDNLLGCTCRTPLLAPLPPSCNAFLVSSQHTLQSSACQRCTQPSSCCFQTLPAQLVEKSGMCSIRDA